MRNVCSEAARYVQQKYNIYGQHPVFKKFITGFLHLNIAKKILLGYVLLVALIFVISAFAVSSLERLNDINGAIVKTDVPVVETAEKMIDTVISQEFYARRYAILNSSEMLALSQKKGKEFDGLIKSLGSLPGIRDFPLDHIAALHFQYNNLLSDGIGNFRDPTSLSAGKRESVIMKKQEELIGLIKSISNMARQQQKERTVLISLVGSNAIRISILLCLAGIFLSIGSTILITRNIAGPISHLKMATQKISEGKFDYIKEVGRRDELGELAHAFNEMTKRLRHLEEMYLDASPLTRLPGNIAIENVLRKRIEAGSPLAFCYIDLDDFKSFNDRYGYAKGSEVIIATSKIIEKSVAESGTSDDFVGHIGGDDFVVITTPDHFKKSCDNIIETFDKAIPMFYDKEDRDKGFIISKSRGGSKIQVPLMSISISVVTNSDRPITSAIQVGEIAAELKEYAKSMRGSVLVVDRRSGRSREGIDEQ